MALSLNTSHPLYGNLLALICVDSDDVVKDLKGNQTCTKDAAVTIGTGALGKHFLTTTSGGNSKGVSLSPGVQICTGAKTVFVVTDGIQGITGSRGQAMSVKTIADSWAPAVNASYFPYIRSNDAAALTGAVSVQTGSHSWGGAVDRTGNLSKSFVDGTLIATGVANATGYGTSTASTNIGGDTTGGYGGLSAKFVWLAVFNKYLSDAEISELHSSLGADNAFTLVSSGNAAPTFPGPNIGNLTGAVGVALSANDVHAKFSDVDALTFSAVGSWPPGVTVSSAGVISGTPTTAGTYSALKVRATDTAAQTVDSDTFTFTITTLAAITITDLKDLTTGTLRASESGITAIINNVTTGALVVKLTGLTSTAGGDITISDAALVAATQYRVTIILSDGSEGTWKYTAA